MWFFLFFIPSMMVVDAPFFKIAHGNLLIPYFMFTYIFHMGRCGNVWSSDLEFFRLSVAMVNDAVSHLIFSFSYTHFFFSVRWYNVTVIDNFVFFSDHEKHLVQWSWKHNFCNIDQKNYYFLYHRIGWATLPHMGILRLFFDSCICDKLLTKLITF